VGANPSKTLHESGFSATIFGDCHDAVSGISAILGTKSIAIESVALD
jgi:hypothetical protein